GETPEAATKVACDALGIAVPQQLDRPRKLGELGRPVPRPPETDQEASWPPPSPRPTTTPPTPSPPTPPPTPPTPTRSARPAWRTTGWPGVRRGTGSSARRTESSDGQAERDRGAAGGGDAGAVGGVRVPGRERRGRL